jgi:hypothetical protein
MRQKTSTGHLYVCKEEEEEEGEDSAEVNHKNIVGEQNMHNWDWRNGDFNIFRIWLLRCLRYVDRLV